MHIIELHINKNVFNPEQKKEVITKVTEAVVKIICEIQGRHSEENTLVRFYERSKRDWASDDLQLSAEVCSAI